MRQVKDVVAMMDQFLNKVAAQGASEDSPKFDAKKTIENAGDGTAAQGEAGKEKKEDIKQTPGMEGANLATEKKNDANADAPRAAKGDFNAEGSDDSKKDTKPEDVKVEKIGPKLPTTDSKTATDVQKYARAERLGNAILSQIAALNASNSQMEKAAAEKSEIEKAAEESYKDFQAGWYRGFEKKAEDIKEILASGLVKTAAEAEALLDNVPPEAKLPEEAMPVDAAAAGMDLPPEVAEAAGQLPPEHLEQLNALADQMAEAGVQPEDIAQAAKMMDELTAQGVSPEEIVQAVQEISSEGAPAEEAPKEEAPAEDVAKQAAARHEAIKNYIKGLKG